MWQCYLSLMAVWEAEVWLCIVDPIPHPLVIRLHGGFHGEMSIVIIESHYEECKQHQHASNQKLSHHQSQMLPRHLHLPFAVVVWVEGVIVLFMMGVVVVVVVVGRKEIDFLQQMSQFAHQDHIPQ